MDFSEKITTSLTVLITGFVVVFVVLILLILLITIYGIIVSKAQKAVADKKAKKEALVAAELESKESVKAEETVAAVLTPTTAGGLTDEVVAVIAAAVDAMYGEGVVKVKSIKKVPQSRPVWSTAGILDNTRPF